MKNEVHFKSKLSRLFRHAQEYYEVLGFETQQPRYTLLAREFEAGLEILGSLVGDSDLFEHHDVLVGAKQSLVRFREDVNEAFRFQALLVTRVSWMSWSTRISARPRREKLIIATG